MGYRADFVQKFGELFSSDEARKNCEGHGIDSMELDELKEVVTINFIGGGSHLVSVAGDSLSSIAYDIVRHGL